MSEVTVFKAEFRARGYSETDLETLRAALQPLGSLRMRAKHLPEAGGAAEFWMVVEFIGASAAAGIIGHLATKFYTRLADGLVAFVKRKRVQSKFPAEIYSITISYDDLEIRLASPTDELLERLPYVMEDISDFIKLPAFREDPVHWICLPLEQREGVWRTPMPWESPATGFRYWGIARWDVNPYIEDIYDSVQQQFLNASPEVVGHWPG